MKIDMHCHVLCNCKNINNTINDIYYDIEKVSANQAFDARKLFVKNIVTKIIGNFIEKEGGNIKNFEISAADYLKLLTRLFIESNELDEIVLLALDGVYSNRGNHELLENKTQLMISNKYLYNTVCRLNEELQKSDDERVRRKKFLFGASVSPNRPDWELELNYVCTQTNAVLLKWIPSSMHIEVWNHDHRRFYEMLKYYNLPLLCHVGPEYAFIEGVTNSSFDNYNYLETPLSYGVKVIAAHCAAPFFPTDKNDLDNFISFIKSCNSNSNTRLWADTSALTSSTRLMLIEKIIKNIRPEWLLNGSDFPVPISGYEHLPYLTYDITYDEYLDILNTKNPFDLDVKIKRAHGFSDSILENAEKVLRIK